MRASGAEPLQLCIALVSSSFVMIDVCIARACSARIGGWLSSYLAGGDELERPEGGAHVRDVGLELVESSGDAGLDLIGLGPRGGVGRDLVEGLLRHGGRFRLSLSS